MYIVYGTKILDSNDVIADVENIVGIFTMYEKVVEYLSIKENGHIKYMAKEIDTDF